jgi:hypothetical protein
LTAANLVSCHATSARNWTNRSAWDTLAHVQE